MALEILVGIGALCYVAMIVLTVVTFMLIINDLTKLQDKRSNRSEEDKRQ